MDTGGYHLYTVPLLSTSISQKERDASTCVWCPPGLAFPESMALQQLERWFLVGCHLHIEHPEAHSPRPPTPSAPLLVWNFSLWGMLQAWHILNYCEHWTNTKVWELGKGWTSMVHLLHEATPSRQQEVVVSFTVQKPTWSQEKWRGRGIHSKWKNRIKPQKKIALKTAKKSNVQRNWIPITWADFSSETAGWKGVAQYIQSAKTKILI